MSAPERLETIIREMVHGEVNARRHLTRGLIITYLAPNPDDPPQQQRYSLVAARVNFWPEDQELKIVYACLFKAWRHHPTALIYDTSEWTKRKQNLQPSERRPEGGSLGTFTTYWRQYPIRDIFSAPAALQPTLRAALARR